ncbi:MAG TPA: hypothetical protein VNV86_11150 [Candidatus Acidoferrum sp.]|nr:hypothetical protein [Candidatus Acidoferrum sp.]
MLFSLLVCAGAQAADVKTTMTVTGSGTITGTTFTGTATLTGIGSNLPLAGTFGSSGSGFLAAFVITVNSTDKLNVEVTIPATILAGNATAVGKITGGSGAYAGATGSFPSMPGSGSLTGATLTLTFAGDGTITTSGTGGGGGTPVPTISAVQDAASNTPGIAQGSIFIVKGTNLSASGFTSFPPPRPTSSSGVKVTFTPAAGGTGTDAYLVYLFNQNGVNQIAAILPSTVAAGNYNVTVTNGTASAPIPAQVVATKIGLFTQDSTGTGLASVQNYISPAVVDLNRLTTGSVSGTTISPAKPGQPVIAYGTGLGAYAAGDNTASPAFDFRSSLQISAVVGGVTIPVDYAGRAGYAGEDQINFTLPANIPTGCAVSLQISVNGKLSAPTSIAIAPDAGSTACVLPGYTSAQLSKLDQGGSIITGGFGISQFQITIPSVGPVKSNSISGGFAQLTAYQLSAAAQSNISVIQQGSCQVVQSISASGNPTPGGSLTYLDAGNITVNGPAGSSLSNQVLNKSSNTYSISSTEGFSIPGQTSFSLPAGTYSLNGAGGADVGAFNASITVGSPLTITGGLPNSVNRSAGLTLNWTGGNSSDLVEIIGASSTTSGSGSTAVTTTTSFFCLTTAGKQTFTVPASILTQLSATTGSNTGILEVASGVTATFNATLKSGSPIDAGVFSSFVGIGSTPTYQ